MQRLQALACKRCLCCVFNHQVLRRAGQGGHVWQGQVPQPAGAGDAVDESHTVSVRVVVPMPLRLGEIVA
jgi:hypothetical protein